MQFFLIKSNTHLPSVPTAPLPGIFPKAGATKETKASRSPPVKDLPLCDRRLRMLFAMLKRVFKRSLFLSLYVTHQASTICHLGLCGRCLPAFHLEKWEVTLTQNRVHWLCVLSLPFALTGSTQKSFHPRMDEQTECGTRILIKFRSAIKRNKLLYTQKLGWISEALCWVR